MGTAETGLVFHIVKFLYRFIPAKAVMNVEVKKIGYVLTTDPYGPIAVVTPIPSRYYVKARVSHLRGMKTTISDVLLTIENKPRLSPFDFKPFKTEPGEMNEITISFPVEEEEAVKEGKFKIRFTDIHGKIHLAEGHFPME